MAGDWIKMRTDLLTSPKVVRIASALNADRFRIAGGLLSVWSLFDAHSVDGILEGYTVSAVDELAAWPGFAESMLAVGWLEHDGASLAMPRFDAHNGASAKRRAQDADRKRIDRKSSAYDADEKRTREEKRREDINNPCSPQGEISEVVFTEHGFEVPDDLFNKWAAAYPKAAVEDEIAKAAVWAATNPAKRKKNWARFLNTWIAKAHKNSKAVDEADCPVDKIIELYHKECANLPRVAVDTDHVLRGLIVERWNEAPAHKNSSFWKTIFHRANRMQQIYYRGANVLPRLELICSRSIFRQLEEQQ